MHLDDQVDNIKKLPYFWPYFNPKKNTSEVLDPSFEGNLAINFRRQLPCYQYGLCLLLDLWKGVHVCQLICSIPKPTSTISPTWFWNKFEIMLHKPPYKWTVLALVKLFLGTKKISQKTSRFHNLRFLSAASLGMFHLSWKVETLWGLYSSRENPWHWLCFVGLLGDYNP